MSNPAAAITSIHSCFRTVSAEFTYEVLNLEATSFKLIAAQELVAVEQSRFYERRYRWTGSGVEKDPIVVSSQNADAVLHGPLIRDEVDRIYLLDLGKDMHVGDEFAIAVEQSFIDTAHSAQPYHRVTVRDAMDRLDLALVVPKAFADTHEVSTAVREMPAESTSETGGPVEPQQHDPSTVVYRYAIEHPEVGLRYELLWRRLDAHEGESI